MLKPKLQLAKMVARLDVPGGDTTPDDRIHVGVTTGVVYKDSTDELGKIRKVVADVSQSKQ